MAESEGCPIKIIDHCRVSPPPNSVPSSPLPLTCFDIPWLFMLEETSQLQFLVFYDFPRSTSYLAQNIVPVIKNSLSLTLQKFYPMAAKIVLPPQPATPEILYTDGDSVPCIVAETTASFDELASDNPKDAKLLDSLIPKLSPWSVSEDGTCNIIPDLFAMQVTLFPNSGLTLAFHCHHAVGDGGSLANFLLSFASMVGTGRLIQTSLPLFNRDVIEDPNDLKTTLLKEWSEAYSVGPKLSSPLSFSNADVKTTLHMSKENIKGLKDWISSQSLELKQEPMNISSFAAVCGFIWVCLQKSMEGGKDQYSGSNNNNVQRCHFGFSADCRNRLKIPETYFGNCLAPCLADIEKNFLLGQHGVVFAARAIVESVQVLENKGAMKAIEGWCSGLRVYKVEPSVTVAGSTRIVAYHNKDFALGMPKKFEMVHTHSSGAISLLEGKEEGGLDIGLALDRAAMDTFITLFKGLESFI